MRPADYRDDEGEPRRDIGVALSGGGFRAAAFHLGCLRALHDRGLLPRVRVISGVSGGALLAALYAYGPAAFGEFDDLAVGLLREGLQLAIARRFFTSRRVVEAGLSLATLPAVGLAGLARRLAVSLSSARGELREGEEHPALLRRVNRTTAFADVLASRLYGGHTVRAVTHPGLDVVLTACDLVTGGAVRFGSRANFYSRLGSEILDEVLVADAVAASAAYPALLPALERRYRLRNDAGVEVKRVMLLADGGIYDNLGLSVLDPERDKQYTPHVYDLDYVVACDAGQGLLATATPHIWPTRMIRVVKIMHLRAQHGERGRFYAAGDSGALSGVVHAYLGMDDKKLPAPVAGLVPREAVVAYPTDFAAMSQRDLDALSSRGKQLVGALLPHYCPAL